MRTCLALAVLMIDAPSVVENTERRPVTRDTVVLAKEPIELTPEPRSYTPSPSARIVGETNRLCVVLAEAVFEGGTRQRKAMHDELLGDAELKAILHLDDNSDRELNGSTYWWSFAINDGVRRAELSSCLQVSGEPGLPITARVERFQIWSSEPLEVQGIFWESSDL